MAPPCEQYCDINVAMYVSNQEACMHMVWWCRSLLGISVLLVPGRVTVMEHVTIQSCIAGACASSTGTI